MMLTKRDRELIHHVFEHRFLRSTHIRSLLAGSHQQLLRRLQLLYHHGYLDRPRAQIDYYRQGSRAMVYGLGNKGMNLLERESGIPHRKLDWTTRNRTATRLFIEHTLAVADAMIAVENSSRKYQPQIGFYLSQETPKWTIPFRHEGSLVNIAVVPDRLFALKTRNTTRWFFLEADRATMPVERNNLKQTSFFRKLLAYHETWRQKFLKDAFPRFQILTITTTPERVGSLVAATNRVTQGKGSGLFLFADKQAFAISDDVLQLPLCNGRGETARLLD